MPRVYRTKDCEQQVGVAKLCSCDMRTATLCKFPPASGCAIQPGHASRNSIIFMIQQLCIPAYHGNNPAILRVRVLGCSCFCESLLSRLAFRFTVCPPVCGAPTGPTRAGAELSCELETVLALAAQVVPLHQNQHPIASGRHSHKALKTRSVLQDHGDGLCLVTKFSYWWGSVCM